MSLSLMLLPDELLSLILHKLPYQTCQILAKCCHRMLKIVVRERLYRRDDVHSMEIYYFTTPNYGRYELLCYFMLENIREEWDKKYFLLDLERPFAVQIADEVKYHLEKKCNGAETLISLTDVFLDNWTSANGVWITDGKTEFTIDGVFDFITRRATNTEKSFFCSIDGGGLNFAELEQRINEKAASIGLNYDLKMSMGATVNRVDCRIGSTEFRVEVAQ